MKSLWYENKKRFYTLNHEAVAKLLSSESILINILCDSLICELFVFSGNILLIFFVNEYTMEKQKRFNKILIDGEYMIENEKKQEKKREKGTVSIKDVAKRAGVAPGTVSNALNSTSYVKASTREKIMKAVEELGYVPNRAGRILKTTKTGLVMVAIPDNDNEIYFGMVGAIQKALKKEGYSMLLYYTGGQLREELKAVRMLQEHMVDGLYMVHFSYDETLLEEIKRAQRPVVLCGMCNHMWAAKGYSIDTISIDVYKAIYNTVNHLIQMGHRKIGYLAGTKGTEVYRQRHNAYRAALKDAGIMYDEGYEMWNDYSKISGYNAGRNLFRMENPPTAICASNDHQAIGCWKAIRDLGGKIPEDIALTGLDNLSVSEIIEMTSVYMKEDVVGTEAARILLLRLNGTDLVYQDLYFVPELIVRKSSLMIKRED